MRKKSNNIIKLEKQSKRAELARNLGVSQSDITSIVIDLADNLEQALRDKRFLIMEMARMARNGNAHAEKVLNKIGVDF